MIEIERWGKECSVKGQPSTLLRGSCVKVKELML